MARQPTGEQLQGMPISDVSIKQPVFITMLMLLAIVMGLFAYTCLPVSLLPDFSVPVVSVVTTYPGAGPESVAQQVTEPIEGVVTTLSGIRNMTSTSSEGISVVVIEFNERVNINQALQDAREAVNRVRPTFPSAVKEPTLEPISNLLAGWLGDVDPAAPFVVGGVFTLLVTALVALSHEVRSIEDLAAEHSDKV